MYSDIKPKIIFIAPYWGKNDHVGRYRVERMSRCLSRENSSVTIIWSGWEDRFVKGGKWNELEIRDPLRSFTKNQTAPITQPSKVVEKRFSLRNFIKKIVYYFDNDFVWSFWLTKKTMVKNVCKNADIIISSSPPESIHLASYLLAKKFNLKLVIDMRDGWIDEPLKLALRTSGFKKNIEEKFESITLRSAFKIFVTSDEWKKQLINRYKTCAPKISVITNAYPTYSFKLNSNKPARSRKTLLYAGRFRASRNVNSIESLLDPLIKSSIKNENCLEIKIFGVLTNDDFSALKRRDEALRRANINVYVKEPVTRTLLFEEIDNSDGLLLLAVSKAAIPAKAFEYIPSGKPILAITPRESAVWNLCLNLPQVFLVEFPGYDYSSQVNAFLDFINLKSKPFIIPPDYSELNIGKRFITELEIQNDNGKE